MSSEIDFEARMRECCQKIEETGKAYAEARAQSWLLQEQRKCVLSAGMRKSQAKTMIERENESRCSEKYYQHLEVTADCIKKELSLKAEYEKWQAVFEALRSLGSLEKAKMHIL